MATVDVIITAGQSNMAGKGTQFPAPIPDPAFAWEWDGGLPLKAINDPSSSSDPYKPDLYSCVPQFAITFTQATGRPLVVVRTAVGATSLLAENDGPNGNWSTTGTRFANAIARGNAALADIVAAGHTIASVNVIWHQGETDALNGNNLGAFRAAFEALATRFRTGLSRPTLNVYVARLGGMSSTFAIQNAATEPNWQLIRDAQVAGCVATPGMEMAYLDCIHFPEWGWNKPDGIHYRIIGLNAMGQGLALHIVSDLGFPLPPLPRLVSTSNIAHRLRTSPKQPLPDVVVDYTTVGTNPAFVVPAGVFQLRVECVGAGGGGAGGEALGGGRAGVGGGGARGGDRAYDVIAVVPGQSFVPVVGAGGVGSDFGTPGVMGTAGGISKFGDDLVVAAGGGGGGSTSTANGATRFGGTAVNGVSKGLIINLGVNGADAAGGQTSGSGGAGGAGGTPLGGAGGTGGVTGSSVGKPGTAPGGGGGGGQGATAGANGGAGARGLVRVRYTPPFS